MLHQLDIFGKDKVQTAIDRLKTFEPKEGYFLAFSGGKDSVVLKALADMAQVKYDAHYSITSVDPPALVRFIKEYHPDVVRERKHDKDGHPITMWSLIAKNTMPPTRIARYCCEQLKESSGKGRIVLTGVRWSESINRKLNQGGVSILGKSKKLDEILQDEDIEYTKGRKGGIILNLDNADSRRGVEICYRTHKTLVNPIIDWEDDDVWEFIHEYNIPYCVLYDEGHKRLGCIGCPMGMYKNMKREFEKYPKYKNAYLRAFRRMLLNIAEKGKETIFRTPEGVMEWWMQESRIKTKEYEKRALTEKEIQALKEWTLGGDDHAC